MTTLFCLHALGSSSREFERLRIELAPDILVRALDLPGFGGTTAEAGTTVDDMVIAVERAIGTSGATEWALLGHSMGGKIASIVAARTLDGSNGLFGLRAVVLLAASPLSPEPMDEARRESMLSWVADGRIPPDHAEEFVVANTSAGLSGDAHAAALADLERTEPEAWSAWLRRGSREDRSGEFLPSPIPALIIAGADDGDLGVDAQKTLNLPHWSAGELSVIEGAAHLLPWEQPEAVATAIAEFFARRIVGPVTPPAFARTIASPRVSARTRGLLAARALADDPSAAPTALTDAQLETLRAVAGIVVPQEGTPIDLALRVDRQLAQGRGDGWRLDGSPVDAEAYRLALDFLGTVGDGALAQTLDGIRDGRIAAPTPGLTARALTAWLEDATVDLVKQWVGHPATMAAMDYDGFANGGDGPTTQGLPMPALRTQGFHLLGAGQREAWEPTGASK